MLLEPEPSWRLELQEGETGGILGHVRLLPELVAGCWFALERATGTRLWSGVRTRANDVFGVSGDVLIATRQVAEQKQTVSAGLWGVHAATGELLWGEATQGMLQRLTGALSRIFGRRAPTSDGPLSVQSELVYTRDRRVLHALSGTVISTGVAPPPEPEGSPDEELSSELFFLRTVELPGTGLRLLRRFDPKDPMEHLKHERCSHPEPVPMNFGAIDSSEKLAWERRYEKGKRVGTSYLGSRLAAGRLLAIESGPSSGTARVAVVNARTGWLEQSLPLATAAACIQDLDERGLLVGLGAETSEAIRGLAYYRLRTGQ